MKRKTKIITSVIIIFIAGIIIGICAGMLMAHQRISAFKDMRAQKRYKFMMQHLSHKLSLTDKQKSQIRPLILSFNKPPKIDSEKIKALVREQKALIESEHFDEQKFRKLYKQISAVKEDIAVKQALIKRQVYDLLTDEQKKKFETLFQRPRGKQRKFMLGKQRKRP